ncbi:N-acetyltransferase family protein [Sporomusa aerivorans]|uniref:GNAT family N-acetyltransferase n=1 Tax=Sporomusa aerivorans TaxID=204936 RepID=UPI00352AF287
MNKEDLVIRPIRPADIKAVQSFLLRQLKELFSQEGQPAMTEDVWGLEKRYVEPANCNMWGIFTPAGEVAGTAAICTYNDRIALLKGRYNLPVTAEVGRCYIDQRLRRQGLGAKLLAEMTAFCREQGYAIMYLHTHRFLPGGFNFWKKEGFVITLDEGGSAELVHMEKWL